MSKSFISYAMAVNVPEPFPMSETDLSPYTENTYAMHDLNNTTSPIKVPSCGRGFEISSPWNSAVYDALVRMAQDFSARATLIDGHGNSALWTAPTPNAKVYRGEATKSPEMLRI